MNDLYSSYFGTNSQRRYWMLHFTFEDIYQYLTDWFINSLLYHWHVDVIYFYDDGGCDDVLKVDCVNFLCERYITRFKLYLKFLGFPRQRTVCLIDSCSKNHL
jgi:hypothetical protein